MAWQAKTTSLYYLRSLDSIIINLNLITIAGFIAIALPRFEPGPYGQMQSLGSNMELTSYNLPLTSLKRALSNSQTKIVVDLLCLVNLNDLDFGFRFYELYCIFDCCKQSLKQLLPPSTHPPIHPPIQPETFFMGLIQNIFNS